MDGNLIDSMISYKLPKESSNSDPFIQDGLGFTYLDTNEKWQLSSVSINDSTSWVARTLTPTYFNLSTVDDSLYIAYNDEHPDGKETSSHGHTKGIVWMTELGG